MKITVIGASAGVGLLAVKVAVQRGHIVTSLSRSKLPISVGQNLKEVTGSATSSEQVFLAIRDADAVIVALGTGTSRKPTTLYTDTAQALIEAFGRMPARPPVLVLTGFGAGDSGNYQGFWMKLLFRFLLKDVYGDKTNMEEIITGSHLCWEIVRPGMLTDKPFSGEYRVHTVLERGMKMGSISRENVAHFLVMQAEKPSHLGKFVSLTE